MERCLKSLKTLNLHAYITIGACACKCVSTFCCVNQLVTASGDEHIISEPVRNGNSNSISKQTHTKKQRYQRTATGYMTIHTFLFITFFSFFFFFKDWHARYPFHFCGCSCWSQNLQKKNSKTFLDSDTVCSNDLLCRTIQKRGLFEIQII